MIFENTCPYLLLQAALPDKTPKYSTISQNLRGNVALPHLLAAFSHPQIQYPSFFFLETAEHVTLSHRQEDFSRSLSSIREEILRKEIPWGHSTTKFF
jgi:hypothetical protein